MTAEAHVCALAEQFRASTLWKAILLWQVFFATISLIVIGYSVIWISKRRQVGHSNLKILFINAYIFYAVSAISELITKGSFLFRYMIATNSCNLVTVTSVCLALRAPAYICITAFTIVHVSIAFERFWATYRRQSYERHGKSLGVILTVVTWSVAIATNAFLLRDMDLGEPRSFCNVTTKGNHQTILLYYAALILVDVLATITHVILLNFNKIRLKQMMERYNLSECYQLKENITVMYNLIPLLIFHCIIYGTYLGFTAVVRFLIDPSNFVKLVTFIELVNIVPIYTALLPLCILYLISRIHCGIEKKMSNIIAPANAHNLQDVYFQELRSQWNQKS